MNRPTVPTSSLVLHAVAADAPQSNGPERCSLCGGPPRLCGGTLRCSGAVATHNELRWLTGIRCVYGALLLTPTPASRWGGSLLRMGRLVVAGSTPPARVVEVAADHAPLFRTPVSRRPVPLALAYLEHEDLDRLWELRELVDLAFREGSLSPWLDDLLVGVRAALATPLDKMRVFPVFAVRCEKCWGPDARGPRRRLFEHVDTYDQAIRCPGCGEVPTHPLPGVKIGEPHPVGRCVGGAYGARSQCMAHEGYELDRAGLCLEGRAVLVRAMEEAAAMVHHDAPMDPALVDAVMRAQAIARKAQHEADLTALGHQMERFVTEFQAGGGTVDAANLDQVMTTFGDHVRAAVGDAFDTGVTGLLQILGLDRLLGVKRKRKRKKKAKRLGAGGTT
jgi:hypothetical protein